MDKAFGQISLEEPVLAAVPDRHAQFLMLFLGSEREVFRYICAIVPNVVDAQDILQQTALALWRKFEEYDAAQPFTPWACRFAMMEMKAFLRRQSKWHALLEGDLADVLAQRRESMMPQLDRKLLHLTNCLKKLPQPQGELISGYYFHRKTVEELSVSIGKSVEAVYKTLQRVRRLLLDCVETSAQKEEAGI